MSWNRRHRFVTVLLALLSLLFMQLALAGYSCAGNGVSQAVEIAPMAQTGMPCVGSMTVAMDDVQPSLCATHCKSDPQTADKYQVPAMAAVPAPGIGILLSPVSLPTTIVLWQASLLRRNTAASLAVRNCCFRL